MMKAKTTIILYLLFLSSLSAQIFSGQIIDTEGNVLSGASIAIFENKKLKRDYTTDAAGNYSIHLEQKEEASISFLGYQTQYLDQEAFQFDNLLVLQTDIYDLETVTVLGRKVDIVVCGSALKPAQGTGTICFTYTPGKDSTKVDLAGVTRLDKWSYFPNPARDFIQINTKYVSAGTIVLFHSSGTRVGAFTTNTFPMQIPLSNLPNGTYFLQYRQSNRVEGIGKFIKS